MCSKFAHIEGSIKTKYAFNRRFLKYVKPQHALLLKKEIERTCKTMHTHKRF